MHIADVFSLIPTPDPAIIFIGFFWTELLTEVFSKEAIAHISKFCVMSRSKPDFAKEIPYAFESCLSKPTEWISIFISFCSLGIFINSKFSNGNPTSFFNADLAAPATHKGKENPFFKSSNWKIYNEN